MPFITWKKGYSVGVEKFDKQHKRIFALINELYVAVVDRDLEKVHRLGPELADYSKYHLETEEKYFRKYKYPHKEEHAKEHERLLAVADSYNLSFGGNDWKTHHASMDFLREWTLEHLLQQDMQYVDFFADKKVE